MMVYFLFLILNFEFIYHGLYLYIQFFKRSIVRKYIVSELHAGRKILFGRICIYHLPLLVGDEFLERDFVRFASSQYHSFISDLRVRIDRKKQEMLFLLQRFDFAYRSQALDDSVLAVLFRLFIQLLYNIGRAECCTQIIGDDDHAIPIDGHASLLDFLDQKCADRIMFKSFFLDKVIDNGSFTCTKRSGYSDNFHGENVMDKSLSLYTFHKAKESFF